MRVTGQEERDPGRNGSRQVLVTGCPPLALIGYETLSKSLPPLASVSPSSNEVFQLLSPRSFLISVSPEGHKSQPSVFTHLDTWLIRIGILPDPLLYKL